MKIASGFLVAAAPCWLVFALATGCHPALPSSDDGGTTRADSKAVDPGSPAPGITREAHEQVPPGPPGKVDIVHRDGLHVVEWNGTRDDTILGYEVYRRSPDGTWAQAGFVRLRSDDPRNRGRYAFEERLESACEYAVAAVGATGTPGPKSIDIH